MKSKGQLDDGSNFIDIFGPKKDGNINDSLLEESEADLNADEMAILDEFDKNDQELEAIAGQICGALDGLSKTAEDMEKKAKDAGKQVDNHLNKKLDAIQAEVIKNHDFSKYEEPEELEGDAESQAK